MGKILAYCGLDCGHCPAYEATKNNDDQLRARTAAAWSKEYGIQIKPEDVVCDGCRTDNGRHLGYCSVCQIRRCAREKQLPHCAACADYPCATLTAFFAKAIEAKSALEALRGSV